MCLKSWGRNTCARALIEVSSEKELLESLVVAIPFPNETGHTLEMIKIEYEWQPPRCAECKIFDHTDDHWPKKIKEATKDPITNDGFTEVTRKHGKDKKQSKTRKIDGIKLSKPPVNFAFRPVKKKVRHQLGRPWGILLPNSSLIDDGDSGVEKEEAWTKSTSSKITVNDSAIEEVEELVLEEPIANRNKGVSDTKGASTPYEDVSYV
ncbi:zinc knuckle CX2CX4HX4C containing protein [Tanacetum coccineum]